MTSFRTFTPGVNNSAYEQFRNYLQNDCPTNFDRQIKRDFALNNPIMIEIMMKSMARRATIQVAKEDWGISRVDLFETASVMATNLQGPHDSSTWKLIETVYQAEQGSRGKVKQLT